MPTCLDCLHCKVRLYCPDGSATLRCELNKWGNVPVILPHAQDYEVAKVRVGRWRTTMRQPRIRERKIFETAEWCGELEVDDG